MHFTFLQFVPAHFRPWLRRSPLKPNMKVLCLLSALSVSAAVVQTTTVQVLSGANKVNAYAAAANGKLTPISGSPFADNLTSMVVNGKYLLGSNKAGVYVAAFL